MTTQKPKKSLVYKKENDFKPPKAETSENTPKEIEKANDTETKVDATSNMNSTSHKDQPSKEEIKIDTQTEVVKNRVKKPLNSKKAEFIPQTYGGQNFDLEDLEIEPEDELLDDDIKQMDMENREYFHQASKNCDCCKGYINKCNGPFCKELESCYCFATQEQEDIYNKRKSSF